MTLRSPADASPALRAARAVAGLALAVGTWLGGSALAADMPDVLRGPVYTEEPAGYVPWNGIVLGAQAGYHNFTADFSSAVTTTTLTQPTTNSASFGAFLGYNIQWEHLVVGIDGAYNRPSSLETSVSSGASSATVKLVDYATLRARAGYAFGQFLPYGFVGAAAGRFNYAIVSGASSTSRDDAYAAGFVAGLGIDVAILPNLFLRAEYEYVAFSQLGYVENSVFGGFRPTLNTGRVGLGLRF